MAPSLWSYSVRTLGTQSLAEMEFKQGLKATIIPLAFPRQRHGCFRCCPKRKGTQPAGEVSAPSNQPTILNILSSDQ